MKNPLRKILALIIGCLAIILLISFVFLFNDIRQSRQITQTDVLSGQRIGVMSGWEADYFLSNRDDITIKRYDTLADLYMALNYKQVDALGIGSPTFMISQKSISGIKQVGNPLATFEYAVYVGKENVELLNQINTYFEVLKNSDEYPEFEKHFNDLDWMINGEYTKSTGKGEPLKIGYNLDCYPFEFVGANGELRGIEVELMTKLANYYDRQIEFIPVSWESYTMDINKGVVDIVVCAACDMYRAETETSVSSVSMSVGYAKSDIICIVVDGKMKISNGELFDE